MKKLSVKDLVDFRRKTSDRSKKTFVERLKSIEIAPPSLGGGDYWITSLSAVCGAYKKNDLNLIDEKIIEVQEKFSITRHSITKTMYQRNILILKKFKSMDIKKLRPSGKLTEQKKSLAKWFIILRGIEIEVDPKRCHVYTFGMKGEESVGAIWFIAKVDGYHIEEVGMFCEMLYRFLKNNYSKKYQINPLFCITADLASGNVVKYSEIESGAVKQALTSTIDDINQFI